MTILKDLMVAREDKEGNTKWTRIGYRVKNDNTGKESLMITALGPAIYIQEFDHREFEPKTTAYEYKKAEPPAPSGMSDYGLNDDIPFK